MTILLSIIQFALMSCIILYEYNKHSTSIFLWATSWIMFGAMHVITCIINTSEYSVEVLNTASMFVIAFEILYLLMRILAGAFIKSNNTVAVKNQKVDSKIARIMLFILIVATVWYCYRIYSVSGSLLNISKANVYKLNAATTLWDRLMAYLYSATSPVFLFFLIKHSKWGICISGACIVTKSLLSGSRTDIIIILVGVICYIAFYGKKKLSVGKLILLALMGVLAIYVIYALRTFRLYGGFAKFLTEFEFVDFHTRLAKLLLSGNGELGYRAWFYQFIENNNNYAGFGEGAGYKRVLLFAIPSSLLDGLKPQDFCRTMGLAIDPTSTNYTVTPTLFGDCFGNRGFWGCLYGIFWGFVVTIFDKIAYRKNELLKAMYICLIAAQFVNIGRGNVYNPICQVYYGTIIIAMIYFGYKFFRYKRY